MHIARFVPASLLKFIVFGDSSCNMYLQEPLDGNIPHSLLIFASSLSLTLGQSGRLVRHLLAKPKIRGSVSERCEPWSGSGSGISGSTRLKASWESQISVGMICSSNRCLDIEAEHLAAATTSSYCVLCLSARLATKPFRARTLASNG